MKNITILATLFLLFLPGCKKETPVVCKNSKEVEKPSVLRCPRCFRRSAAEKVRNVNQQMLLCPECKKVSPAVKFYQHKRR